MKEKISPIKLQTSTVLPIELLTSSVFDADADGADVAPCSAVFDADADASGVDCWENHSTSEGWPWELLVTSARVTTAKSATHVLGESCGS